MILYILDLLGAGVFAVSGALAAGRSHLDLLGVVVVAVVILMGTIIGTAGGVFRDMLLANIPVIFNRGRIYATASIVGIVTYLLLSWASVLPSLAAIVGMAVVFGLRLAAIVWGLMLPIFSLADKD